MWLTGFVYLIKLKHVLIIVFQTIVSDKPTIAAVDERVQAGSSKVRKSFSKHVWTKQLISGRYSSLKVKTSQRNQQITLL